MSDAPQAGRPSMERTVDAVVVGGGFGGLYMLHRLRELGLTVQGFEAGGDVGGTWYWNRYPGARCDVPSLMYSYTWSEPLLREWRWSEKYAAQPEILRYAGHVADRYGLREQIAFDTRVTAATFDEAADEWLVETDSGDRVRARWCVMATGCLSVPQTPEIPGAEHYRGPIYHTGRWPHQPVAFTGLRVGVIGTGSSAIQSIPQIAAQAASLTVFQRTPNYSVPANNGPLTDRRLAAHRAAYPDYLQMLRTGLPGLVGEPSAATPVSEAERRALYEKHWGAGGIAFLTAFPNLFVDPAVNEIAADFVRAKIAEKVSDPAVAERLTPRGHPIGTKRICVDIDFYETFNRPNVELVDVRAAPIVGFTEDGVRTAEADYALDAVVLATGFDAITGALNAIAVRGAGRASLRDAWADGPAAYLGLMAAGFPNLFIVTGPGSPSVLSNMLPSIEQHVDWIAGAVAALRDRGFTRMEADPAAQAAWMARVKAAADASLFPRADSWYMGANIPGKPRVFPIYIGPGYKQACDAAAAAGYTGFKLS